MNKRDKIKKENKLYALKRIILLMNRANELYKEEDFFAAYGLFLIINRLLGNIMEE